MYSGSCVRSVAGSRRKRELQGSVDKGRREGRKRGQWVSGDKGRREGRKRGQRVRESVSGDCEGRQGSGVRKEGKWGREGQSQRRCHWGRSMVRKDQMQVQIQGRDCSSQGG